MSTHFKQYRKLYVNWDGTGNNFDMFFVGPFKDWQEASDWIGALIKLTIDQLEVRWEGQSRVGKPKTHEPYSIYPASMSPMEVFTLRDVRVSRKW